MITDTTNGLAILTFAIDTSGSRFTVQAFATGMLSTFGHNPTIGISDYEGQIQCTPETWEQAVVRVKVHTQRMEVLDEMKSEDRRKLEHEMYNSVLESARFPEAFFESESISVQKLSDNLLTANVTGNLSFHGVKQQLAFSARITRFGSMLRISGEFPLRQSEYGIKPVSFAGGALRLKDEVKFKFELVARQQE
jgi:polyisoprenoid-binding protein YceI